jgi:hypothetical protein
MPKRYRPFPIIQKISDTTYRLKLPPHWKIYNTFHAKLLTPYRQTDKYRLNFLEPHQNSWTANQNGKSKESWDNSKSRTNSNT